MCVNLQASYQSAPTKLAAGLARHAFVPSEPCASFPSTGQHPRKVKRVARRVASALQVCAPCRTTFTCSSRSSLRPGLSTSWTSGRGRTKAQDRSAFHGGARHLAPRREGRCGPSEVVLGSLLDVYTAHNTVQAQPSQTVSLLSVSSVYHPCPPEGGVRCVQLRLSALHAVRSWINANEMVIFSASVEEARRSSC